MKPINKIMTIREAIAKVKNGDRIMVGGFGLRGTPDSLIDALVEHPAKDLTIISNDLGSPGIGLGKLLRDKKIRNLIGNYYNWNPEVAEAYNAGEIGVTLVPQGTFAESIRAAGVGIPAYYTPTSAGTELGKGKEPREFNGKTCVLEEAIGADVALIRACKADTLGNLLYCKVARNFNPAMAMAAASTIALVDEIVEPGELDPESIVTAHIFVDALVQEVK
jgi:3-oxoacid CoA-transferase A subunit